MVNILRYPLPMKAKLVSKDPTQRIRDRTTNETRDTPKIVWASTAFSRWQDTQMSCKSEHTRMKICRKGGDASMKNLLSELWTRWSKPPRTYWMLPWEQCAVRRRSLRSNKFPKGSKFAMVPWATKLEDEIYSKGRRFVTPWFSQLFLFLGFSRFCRWFGFWAPRWTLNLSIFLFHAQVALIPTLAKTIPLIHLSLATKIP